MNLSDYMHYATYEQLRTWVADFTYRPGWSLSVFNDPHEGPCLLIETEVPDGYHPDQHIKLRIRSAIPPIPDLGYFGEWLLWRLMQVEIHECREYLRFRGQLIRDPHDPIQPYDEKKEFLTTDPESGRVKYSPPEFVPQKAQVEWKEDFDA